MKKAQSVAGVIVGARFNDASAKGTTPNTDINNQEEMNNPVPGPPGWNRVVLPDWRTRPFDGIANSTIEQYPDGGRLLIGYTMRIDYTKPIMFDQDTNGGLGAGTWQINPSRRSGKIGSSPTPSKELSAAGKRVLFLGWAILAICGVCSISFGAY